MKTQMKKPIYFTLAIGMMTIFVCLRKPVTQHGNILDPVVLDKLSIGATKQLKSKHYLASLQRLGLSILVASCISQQMEDAPGKWNYWNEQLSSLLMMVKP